MPDTKPEGYLFQGHGDEKTNKDTAAWSSLSNGRRQNKPRKLTD